MLSRRAAIALRLRSMTSGRTFRRRQRVAELRKRQHDKRHFCFAALLFLVLFPTLASAQAWIQLAPTGGPPQDRVAPGAAYIPSANRLLIFGGYPVHTAGSNVPTNDLWALDGANGSGTAQWTQLIPSDATGSPSGRLSAPMFYDPSSNRMILFGGESSANFYGLNDVWILTNADGLTGTPTWSQLSVTGSTPGPRTNLAAAYDPNTNRLIIYGGVNEQNGLGIT